MAPTLFSPRTNPGPPILARALSLLYEVLDERRINPSPLFPRISPRDTTPSGGYVRPKTQSAGILVVFSLIGASIGLLVLWLFVRHGGFIWRSSDWEDYKSTILRRPQGRPDDAVTVFSDGSTRRGGGSTQGARTVVLGELDTTYTRSKVSSKPWGPRDMKPKHKPKGSIWGTGEGSIWGKLRGGDRPSDTDTQIQREKEMNCDTRSVTTIASFIDTQEPARPAGWRPEDSDLTSHYPNLDRNETVVRHPRTRSPAPSYHAGDDNRRRHHRTSSHQRRTRPTTTTTTTRGQKQKQKQKPEPIPKPITKTKTKPKEPRSQTHQRHQKVPSISSSSSAASSSSEESSDDDDDNTSINQSQLGMAKGTKVYSHPLPKDGAFWATSRAPVERNGGGAGGTYGGAPSTIGVVRAPGPQSSRGGYRAGSAGSLSSVGSVGSSNAGVE